MNCCVPGCKRTTKRAFTEWVCGKHWSLTSRVWRRRMFRFRRHHRVDLADRMWCRLRDQAIERAMGL
jgi:hypothetical protein